VRIDPLLSSDSVNIGPLLGRVRNRKTVFSVWSAPRLLLCNDEANTPLQQQRLCFLRGPCRGVILKTIGATGVSHLH
jgi:hypothetical protein